MTRMALKSTHTFSSQHIADTFPITQDLWDIHKADILAPTAEFQYRLEEVRLFASFPKTHICKQYE